MAPGQPAWMYNTDLHAELKRLSLLNVKHREKLVYINKKFRRTSGKNWSLRTLNRMVNFLGIKQHDDVSLNVVRGAVKEQLEGVGKAYGYRAMNEMIRMEYGIKVKRDLVYDVLTDLNHEGLQERRPRRRPKRRKKPFSSDGPMYLVSLDGHNKLKGYMNWVYPVGIYGCIDTFSRKILWLKSLRTNSDPRVIGLCYYEFLKETKVLPKYMRLDHGTETGTMTLIQSYLTSKLRPELSDPTDSVKFGPSTDNKIERLWLDVRTKVCDSYKDEMRDLEHRQLYDPSNKDDRDIMSYVFIPVVQGQLDKFTNWWNNHTIRKQTEKIKILPDGVPNLMFEYPDETEGFTNLGVPISDSLLDKIPGLFELPTNLEIVMNKDIEHFCTTFLSDPCISLKAKDAADAYVKLRQGWAVVNS